MGSWNNKPFGNDTALDWVSRLLHADSEDPICSCIRGALDSNDVLDAPISEEAIAAAAVVAAAAKEPIRAVTKDISAWIRTRGYVPDKALIADAIKVLEAVMAESELRDLWDESERLQGWLKSTANVQQRLVSALNSELPVRKPKKPGMPRLLYKLVERYEREPEDSVRVKIRSKLDALEDLEQPTKDTRNETPLVLVTTAGLLDEARSLLDRGADPNGTSRQSGGKAVTAACKSGKLEMLELILDAGAEFVTEYTRIIDEDGTDSTYTYVPALLGALRFGTPEMIKLVEDRGADINELGINGETMLYEACYLGNTAVVDYLLQRGFDPNDMGNYHETPLFTAVRGGHIEVVKLLINAGADVNKREHWGGTPLDYADNNQTIADLLVANGAVPEESTDSN